MISMKQLFCRLQEFNNWMDQVEHQVKDLETQGMSPEQYKDSIGKFKVHF